MDECGIEMSVLSLNSPGIQAIPEKKRAIDVARRANDFIAEQAAKRSDRVLFSVDYPFEKMSQAAEWFDRVDTISETDWVKIARTNAEKLLNLALLPP